jgi:hypothetical protein
LVEFRDVEHIRYGARNISGHLKVLENFTKIGGLEKLDVRGISPSLVEPHADPELEHKHEHSRCQALADLPLEETLERQSTVFISDDTFPVIGQQMMGRPEPCCEDRHKLLQLDGGLSPGGGDVTFRLGKGGSIGGSDMLICCTHHIDICVLL